MSTSTPRTIVRPRATAITVAAAFAVGCGSGGIASSGTNCIFAAYKELISGILCFAQCLGQLFQRHEMNFGQAHQAFTFLYWVREGTCVELSAKPHLRQGIRQVGKPPRTITEATLSVRLANDPDRIEELTRFFYQAKRIPIGWAITEQAGVYVRRKADKLWGHKLRDPVCVLRIYGLGPREHVLSAMEYARTKSAPDRELAVKPRPVLQSVNSAPSARPLSARVRSTSVMRSPRVEPLRRSQSSNTVFSPRSAPPRHRRPVVPRLPSLENLTVISLSDEDPSEMQSSTRSSSSQSYSSSSSSSGAGSVTTSDVTVTHDGIDWVQQAPLDVSESQSEMTSFSYAESESQSEMTSFSYSESAVSSPAAPEGSENEAAQAASPPAAPRFAWLSASVSVDEEEEEDDASEEASEPPRQPRRRKTMHRTTSLHRIVVLSQARARRATGTFSPRK